MIFIFYSLIKYIKNVVNLTVSTKEVSTNTESRFLPILELNLPEILQKIDRFNKNYKKPIYIADSTNNNLSTQKAKFKEQDQRLSELIMITTSILRENTEFNITSELLKKIIYLVINIIEYENQEKYNCEKYLDDRTCKGINTSPRYKKGTRCQNHIKQGQNYCSTHFFHT